MVICNNSSINLIYTLPSPWRCLGCLLGNVFSIQNPSTIEAKLCVLILPQDGFDVYNYLHYYT